jgi:hypothetical protein
MRTHIQQYEDTYIAVYFGEEAGVGEEHAVLEDINKK